jgi:hypothetical protein
MRLGEKLSTDYTDYTDRKRIATKAQEAQKKDRGGKGFLPGDEARAPFAGPSEVPFVPFVPFCG